MNDGEQRALSNIEQYGCHVLHVLADDAGPEFSYSMGIMRETGKPELVIVGLKRELAHFIVNEYNRRIREGEVFVEGELYGGFLEGFDVMFKAVEEKHHRERFGWNLWLYGDEPFDVFQLVYPTTSGKWPWDEGAEELFQGFHERLYAEG